MDRGALLPDITDFNARSHQIEKPGGGDDSGIFPPDAMDRTAFFESSFQSATSTASLIDLSTPTDHAVCRPHQQRRYYEIKLPARRRWRLRPGLHATCMRSSTPGLSLTRSRASIIPAHAQRGEDGFIN